MNTNKETNTLTNTQPTTTTTETNTTFVDQAISHEEYAQQDPVSIPPPQVMPDEAWFAAKQLSKPIIIETVQWDSTQLFNATLWTAKLPDLISSIDSLQQRTLRMYAFYRMNPILRVQLNGTPFHQGQFVLGWVPFDLRVPDTFPGYFSVVGLTGFPSVQVSAANAESTELKIPFVHLYDYMMTNSKNDISLGDVYLRVLNPLRYSTGASPSLTITISLYADSPEVHVPMYDHDIQYSSSIECEPTGLFSNMGAAVGHLTTGNLKGFFQSGSKAQSNMADLFDKPSYPATVQKTITPVSAMSHGKGTETTVRLGLDPTAMSVKPPYVFGNVIDEMTIEHVIQTPMLFHQFGWTDMATTGTILTSFFLNPRLSYVESLTPAPVIFQPSYLAWISSMYAFWRGGFDLHLDIISTQFHSGRMLIAYIPNSMTDTPTLTQAYSCPNIIVDIKTTSTIDFNIPFLSQVPYKTVDNETNSDGTIGRIFIYVLNQLVHPDNVAPEIEVNMYIAASKDFELSVPRDFPLYQIPTPGPPSIQCEPTGDIVEVQQTKTEKQTPSISLAFGDPTLRRVNRFGEDFPLVDYIKRFGDCDNFDEDQEIRISPATNFINLEVANRFTYSPVAAVAQLFACWYGSLRYKFIFDAPRNTQNVVSIVHKAGSIGATANLGNPYYVTALAQDVGVEIEAPCYVPWNIVIVPSFAPLAAAAYTQTGVLTLQQTAAPADRVKPKRAYIAAGDDLRFFYMVAPPTICGPLYGVTQ